MGAAIEEITRLRAERDALQARVADLEGVLESIKEYWNGGDESAMDAAEECRHRAAIALEGKKDE